MQQFDQQLLWKTLIGEIKFGNVSSLKDIQITRWHRMQSIYQDFYLHQIRSVSQIQLSLVFERKRQISRALGRLW